MRPTNLLDVLIVISVIVILAFLGSGDFARLGTHRMPSTAAGSPAKP